MNIILENFTANIQCSHITTFIFNVHIKSEFSTHRREAKQSVKRKFYSHKDIFSLSIFIYSVKRTKGSYERNLTTWKTTTFGNAVTIKKGSKASQTHTNVLKLKITWPGFINTLRCRHTHGFLIKPNSQQPQTYPAGICSCTISLPRPSPIPPQQCTPNTFCSLSSRNSINSIHRHKRTNIIQNENHQKMSDQRIGAMWGTLSTGWGRTCEGGPRWRRRYGVGVRASLEKQGPIKTWSDGNFETKQNKKTFIWWIPQVYIQNLCI